MSGPARLARALMHAAGDDCTRAFALGWTTHVLADALVHPLINRVAGSLDPIRQDTALTFADDPVMHIRVEFGLDALMLARYGGTAAAGRIPMLAPDSIARVLEMGYRMTYGLASLGPALRTSVRALGRMVPAVLVYDRAAAWWLDATARRPSAAVRAAFPAIRMASRLMRRSVAYGFSHPIAPPEKLVADVTETMNSFAERFANLVADNLTALPNYNLDTGAIGPLAESYPLAVRTVQELNRRLTSQNGLQEQRAEPRTQF